MRESRLTQTSPQPSLLTLIHKTRRYTLLASPRSLNVTNCQLTVQEAAKDAAVVYNVKEVKDVVTKADVEAEDLEAEDEAARVNTDQLAMVPSYDMIIGITRTLLLSSKNPRHVTSVINKGMLLALAVDVTTKDIKKKPTSLLL